MRTLPVMEIFGPTIQGEGLLIGQKTMFLRTGGCDYSCAWCDSAFTWNGSEKATQMTAQQVFDELLAIGGNNFRHVTISGGNPLLIGDAMSELLDLLQAAGYQTSIETQGTKWQDWLTRIDEITISPKPPSSGMVLTSERKDKLMDMLQKLQAASGLAYSVKIVVFDDTDFDFAKQLFSELDDVLPRGAKYMQAGNSNLADSDIPVHVTALEKLEWLFDKVLQDPQLNDVKPLPQLHTLIWGNKRRT